MKGNPMKEKVAFILPLIFFIGIMWFSSTNKTANLKPAVSEKRVPLPIDNYPQEYIDDIIQEEYKITSFDETHLLKYFISWL